MRSWLSSVTSVLTSGAGEKYLHLILTFRIFLNVTLNIENLEPCPFVDTQSERADQGLVGSEPGWRPQWNPQEA